MVDLLEPGGWAGRSIDASQGNLIAEAERDIEVEDKVLVIKQMRVCDMLEGGPLDTWEATERAHAIHASRCQVAPLDRDRVDVRQGRGLRTEHEIVAPHH